MWAFMVSLSIVLGVPFADSLLDFVPVITAAQESAESSGDVRDPAQVFGRGAVRSAREALAQVERRHRVAVRIEAIDSLDGAWVADVAARRARAAGPEQLYILVARAERDVGVVASRRGPGSRLTDQARERIRHAFLDPLRAGEADLALERGVAAIGTALELSAVTRRGLTRWDALIPVAVVVAAVAVLAVSRERVRRSTRSRRRHRAAPAAPLRHRRFPGPVEV